MVVAVLVGGVEALALIADKFELSGGIWDAFAGMTETFGMLGYLIVDVFARSWIVSVAVYRLKGCDRIETEIEAGALPASSNVRAA